MAGFRNGVRPKREPRTDMSWYVMAMNRASPSHVPSQKGKLRRPATRSRGRSPVSRSEMTWGEE